MCDLLPGLEPLGQFHKDVARKPEPLALSDSKGFRAGKNFFTKTVNSFVKNEHVPEIMNKLDKFIVKELVQCAHKIGVPLLPHSDDGTDDLEEIDIVPRKTSVL